MKTRLLLIFTFLTFIGNSQAPNDCQYAVVVCGNSNVNVDVSGVGTQELANSNTCSSQENNSIWLEVKIETAGTLAFTLTPESTAITEDYDFFVFGPNVSCGNIGQAIRCSTTNPQAAGQGNNLTGMNSTDPDPDEGPGADGDSFVSDIDVLPGESYFIVIDRPIGNSAFSLEWTGTATFPESPSINIDLTTTNIDECDTIAPFDDGITSFDLSTTEADIIGTQTNKTVTFHTTESDANTGNNPLGNTFNNTSNPQTIYVRIEDNTSGCFEIGDFEISINGGPSYNEPTSFDVCDDDTDGDPTNGQVDIDLQIISDFITDGFVASNLNISYHISQFDAENDANPLGASFYNSTPSPVTLFARVEDTNNTICFAVSEFEVNVVSSPVANNTTLIQCDEDGFAQGVTLFNLSEISDEVSNNEADRTVDYYLTLADAENEVNPLNENSYENISNPQVIYARVTNTVVGCFNFAEVTLEISTTLTNDAVLTICDDDGTEDGFQSFNLLDANPIVLAGAPVTLTAAYYETYVDALLETNPLGNSFTNTIPYNQVIYSRVENANNCFGISEVKLIVFEMPQVETQEDVFLCLNTSETLTLTAGLIDDIPNNYLFEWSTGETTTEIIVDEPGSYNVRVFNTNGCFKDRTITVTPSNIATITDIQVIDPIDNNVITVVVSGEGTYEYALNDPAGPYQISNTFTDIQAGIYTVYVRDVKNNCGIVDQVVSVVGFPKFFSPNGDSYNPTWQVKGISKDIQPNTNINIFDRMGRLIKVIDPTGPGWDGTVNGVLMPATDYWFQVNLQDGRTFNGHFALVR